MTLLQATCQSSNALQYTSFVLWITLNYCACNYLVNPNSNDWLVSSYASESSNCSDCEPKAVPRYNVSVLWTEVELVNSYNSDCLVTILQVTINLQMLWHYIMSDGRHRMFDGAPGSLGPCQCCYPSDHPEGYGPLPVDLHGYHPYYR